MLVPSDSVDALVCCDLTSRNNWQLEPPPAQHDSHSELTDCLAKLNLQLAANLAGDASSVVRPRRELLMWCLSDGAEVLLGLPKMTSRVFVPLSAGGGTWKPRKSGTKTWVHTNYWIKRCSASRMGGLVRLVFFMSSSKHLPVKHSCGFVEFTGRWPLAYRYSENSSQPVENPEHAADSVHHPLRMCW